MSLRVNPDLTPTLLAALTENRQREEQALQQISSGRRLNSLSQGPSDAACLVQVRMSTSANQQFLRNLSTLRSAMQAADSAMNSVVLILTRAISLGVQGANGTLSSENRLAIASELRGLRDQLVGLANTSFQGRYIFAGTAVTTEPFSLDAAAPSGVRYDGNSGINSVEIIEGQTVPVNLPGDQIFAYPSADVFQALQDLITALENSGDIGAATAQVQTAFNYVNTRRAFYGNTLSILDTSELLLNQEKLQLAQNEAQLSAADMAEAASNLVQAEISRNATLAAGARISQLSLLDFLR